MFRCSSFAARCVGTVLQCTCCSVLAVCVRLEDPAAFILGKPGSARVGRAGRMRRRGIAERHHERGRLALAGGVLQRVSGLHVPVPNVLGHFRCQERRAGCRFAELHCVCRDMRVALSCRLAHSTGKACLLLVELGSLGPRDAGGAIGPQIDCLEIVLHSKFGGSCVIHQDRVIYGDRHCALGFRGAMTLHSCCLRSVFPSGSHGVQRRQG